MSTYQLIDPNFQYTPRQLQSAFQPIDNHSLESINPSVSLQTDALFPTSSQDLPQLQTIQSNGLPTADSNLLIYNLKKYKYDYFLSHLSCSFDIKYSKFSSPSGICTLPDDRLLVANFDYDNVLLLDINGTVHQAYRDIPTPKDVLYDSRNPSQAIIATRKEAIILDLETKTIVRRTKEIGFYPWNIQYLQEHNVFAACDPSSERIVFFDVALNQIGAWSFNQQNPNPNEPYQKIYPYAACFFHDNTSFVLIHRGEQCELKQCDNRTGRVIKTYPTPSGLRSYSIHGDDQRKCLIADNGNHSLLLINPDQTFEQYSFKSIQEPYSMTFLSTGTLCVTDRSQASTSNGGVAIISEFDLKTK